MAMLHSDLSAAQPVDLGAIWPGLTREARTIHDMHGESSVWSQTNCYADVWIVLLTGLGADPRPLFTSAVAVDCLPGQWEFYKHEHRDLEELYGIRVGELDIWRGLENQLYETMTRGDTLALEADPFWLPDTHGISYRFTHSKTTIIPVLLDPAGRRLEYLHNNGHFVLDGDDYDHVVGEARSEGAVPSPYTELIRLQGFRGGQGSLARGADVSDEVRRLLIRYASRQPCSDPIEHLRIVVRDIAETMIQASRAEEPGFDVQDFYHQASFQTTRQCGLSAQLAAYAVEQVCPGAAENFDAVASRAKKLQFQLGRAVMGREPKIDATLDQMSALWSAAQAELSGMREAELAVHEHGRESAEQSPVSLVSRYRDREVSIGAD